MAFFWLGIGLGALAALGYLLFWIVPGVVTDCCLTCRDVGRAIANAFREEMNREGAPKK